MTYNPGGSKESGDDLVAGAYNFANQPTAIIASRSEDPDEPDYTYYGYPSYAILLVTPDGEVGKRPIEATDGVTGVACLGGAGIRGAGCQLESPRGTLHGAGTGGVGVLGQGGNGDLEVSADPQFSVSRQTFDPGAGVLGIGGYWTGPETAPPGIPGRQARDSRGGAGVIGVAGGDKLAPVVPSFDQTHGVGVYGASEFGVGVLAEGVGNSIGLRAFGRTAVEGFGGEVGVYGRGAVGPGGVFEVLPRERNAPIAQVHIVPAPMWVPPSTSYTPNAVAPNATSGLPIKGKAGDLLVTMQTSGKNQLTPGKTAEATLWFCALSSNDGNDPAVWREVLLGPAIRGSK